MEFSEEKSCLASKNVHEAISYALLKCVEADGLRFNTEQVCSFYSAVLCVDQCCDYCLFLWQVAESVGLPEALRFWCKAENLEFNMHQAASPDVKVWIKKSLKQRATALKHKMSFQIGRCLNSIFNPNEKRFPTWPEFAARET